MLAFEKLCLNHVEQIRGALGIAGVSAEVFSWFSKAKETVDPKTGKKVKSRGAQIDMLIDRADKVINMCEMRFWSQPYVMTQKDEDDIERRVDALTRETGTDKNVIVTLVTTKGLERNEHSECVQLVLTLGDMFA